MTQETICLVYTTWPDQGVAKSMIRSLVEEKLIACGNVFPAGVSLYPWEGSVQEEAEVFAILKTSQSKIDALEEWILKNHPYDVPCMIVMPTGKVSGSYQDWLIETVQ